jgi:predicted enzyme involved in methoxymalonyl-ACP biosynthesis
VLNRKVEQATLNYVITQARLAGVRALLGRYVKTERNGMVKDHYARLGFTPLSGCELESHWRLEVAAYVAPDLPLEIVAPVLPSPAPTVPESGRAAFA